MLFLIGKQVPLAKFFPPHFLHYVTYPLNPLSRKGALRARSLLRYLSPKSPFSERGLTVGLRPSKFRGTTN